MQAFIGLYYPFIHFKDDNWLKAMALYWDKMARIVPAGYETRRDSEVVKKLAGELDFIKNFDPTFTRGPVSEAFASAIRRYAPQIRQRYGVDRRENWPQDPITAAHAPEGSDARLAYVMLDKMDWSLVEALTESGLGELGRGPGGDMTWIGMHPEVADAYMTALAEQMAADNMLRPLTDETLDHVSMGGWTADRLLAGRLGTHDQVISPTARDPTEIESSLACVAIESVIPKNLGAVPVDRIIKLRHKYPQELTRFQEWIHTLAGTLAEELKTVGSPQALRAHLEAYAAKSIKPQVTEFRNLLGSVGVDAAVSALNVEAKDPGLVGSLKAVGVAVAAPPVAVAGFAASLMPVARDAQKAAREKAKESPAAYLMHVEEGLAPAKLLAWVRQSMRKFVLGV